MSVIVPTKPIISCPRVVNARPVVRSRLGILQERS